jgi:hypothetical protein
MSEACQERLFLAAAQIVLVFSYLTGFVQFNCFLLAIVRIERPLIVTEALRKRRDHSKTAAARLTMSTPVFEWSQALADTVFSYTQISEVQSPPG